MSNTYNFTDEELQILDLFNSFIPTIIKKIKHKPKVVNETDVEPSLNPILVKINDKDLEVINSLVRSNGFTYTSQILMIHFLLMNPNNGFKNEEELVDYLVDNGGLRVHQISDILSSYNNVKDRFSNGKVIGDIPSDYLEKRKNGIREYDGKGNKVLKWSGVHR
jgi:hypothetical protein